jgi:hypothetical protein
MAGKTSASARGAKWERGSKGERGPRGSRGKKGERVERIAKELRTQFERFAQLQQQLDQGSRALKMNSAAERFAPFADRNRPKRQSN